MQAPAIIRWKKPRDPLLKFNWDAAINATSKVTSLGGIIRDSTGEVHMVFSSNLNYVMRSKLANALVLRKAIFLCMELEIPTMIFEEDCLRVVKATNDAEESNGETNSIIYDLQILMRAHPAWQVQFVHQEANNVAHIMAKKGCSMMGEKIWMKEFPEDVENSVSRDKLCNVFDDLMKHFHSLL